MDDFQAYETHEVCAQDPTDLAPPLKEPWTYHRTQDLYVSKNNCKDVME